MLKQSLLMCGALILLSAMPATSQGPSREPLRGSELPEKFPANSSSWRRSGADGGDCAACNMAATVTGAPRAALQ